MSENHEQATPATSPQSAPGGAAAPALTHDEEQQQAVLQAADDIAFAPAAKLSDFQLPYGGVFSGRDPTEADMKADNAVRSWLHGAELPVTIGNAVAEEADRAMRATPNMTDGEVTLAMRSCEHDLSRMWGEDVYARRVGLARQMVRELDQRHPGLIEFLEDRPQIANNKYVVMQLCLHAERYYKRKGR